MSGSDDKIIDFARERRRRGPRFNGGLMAVLEVSRDLVCLCRDGVITAINGAGIRLLGAPSNEALLGRRLIDLIISQDARLPQLLSGRISQDQPISVRLAGLDQSLTAVDLQVFRAREIAPDACVVVGRAVAVRAPTRAETVEPPPSFVALADHAMNLICHAVDGSIRYVNPAGIAMLGYPHADRLLGRPVSTLFAPDSGEGGITPPMGGKRTAPLRLMRSDRTPVDVLATVIGVPAQSGTGMLIEARELGADGEKLAALLQQTETLEMRVVQRTRELAQQRALAEERKSAADAARRFTEDLMDTIPTPVWSKDARGRLQTANRAFRDLFGDTATTTTPGGPMPAEDEATDQQLLAGECSRTVFEVALIGPEGEALDVLVNKGAYFDSEGRPVGVIGVMADITDRKAMERELRRLATTDPLTNALNRRQFLVVAEAELNRAIRHDKPLSVIMCDIDHFKAINDSHGHAVGDEAIKAVVAGCFQSLRDHDVLGRLGGEEFAFLLPETDFPGALEVAERLRATIAGMVLACPHSRPVTLTASFGVAARQPADDTVDSVLGRADAALYLAKGCGRNRVEPQ